MIGLQYFPYKYYIYKKKQNIFNLQYQLHHPAFPLASGHPRVEIKSLRYCTLRSTVQESTQSTAACRGCAHTTMYADMWTNSCNCTCEHKVHNSKVRKGDFSCRKLTGFRLSTGYLLTHLGLPCSPSCATATPWFPFPASCGYPAGQLALKVFLSYVRRDSSLSPRILNVVCAFSVLLPHCPLFIRRF